MQKNYFIDIPNTYRKNSNRIFVDNEDIVWYNLSNNLCNDKQSCFNYSDKDSCDKISSCKWDGFYCIT